ncbi:MAG: PEP-CTERM sorting domain-containing protein [Sphingomonas sanxanigenens]|uniref:PEP-CTERM sorting domain-containing protein n=1 Tax=Sphingomonas sanxanigenens TaxID=397260 RepID=A0A2W5C8W3_9SPHN|nr:MAG: PEP-CTERM sorting domain-containing protein [Sphingomonas sanxanigenens]
MKIRSFTLLATAVAAIASAPASADVVTLTFEGVGDQVAVNDFYNGGTDGAGNSGANYGINFSRTSLALIDIDAGGSGNFANEPSPSTVLFFLSGGAATMNVAAGFTTGFSFYYAGNSTNAGSVKVYDGLNGTGNVLATLALTPNGGQCSGDPNGFPFCNFTAFGVTFDGVAKSVDFGGVANQIAFDNVTLGAATPGNGGVPEPATWAMLISGFGLVGGAMRVRRRSASFA